MDNAFECTGSWIALGDVHPTKPWILVLANDVCIWNWRTNKRMHIRKRGQCRSAKFIARKQWFLFAKHLGPPAPHNKNNHLGPSGGNIYVYTCHTLNKANKVMRLKDSVPPYIEKDSVPYNIEVHPTRPLVLLYSKWVNDPMKLLDWDRNWSCTRTFDIVNAEETKRRTRRVVVQAMFNPRDTDNFVTLSNDKRVQIWSFDCSEPIATLEGFEGICRLEKMFTYSADQHLVAAISGPTADIWDLQKGKRIHTLSAIRSSPRPDDNIAALACHPILPVLVTASNYGYIHVWDSTTYRLKKEYMHLDPCVCKLNTEYVNVDQKPKDIAFVGTKRLIITYNNGIEIMDIDLK